MTAFESEAKKRLLAITKLINEQPLQSMKERLLAELDIVSELLDAGQGIIRSETVYEFTCAECNRTCEARKLKETD